MARQQLFQQVAHALGADQAVLVVAQAGVAIAQALAPLLQLGLLLARVGHALGLQLLDVGLQGLLQLLGAGLGTACCLERAPGRRQPQAVGQHQHHRRASSQQQQALTLVALVELAQQATGAAGQPGQRGQRIAGRCKACFHGVLPGLAAGVERSANSV